MTEVGTEGASPSTPARKTGRGRRRGALALVVVASLLVFPAILSIWINRQVAQHGQLDPDEHAVPREPAHPRPALHLPGGPALRQRRRAGRDRARPAATAGPAGRPRGGRAAGPRRADRQAGAGAPARPGAMGRGEPAGAQRAPQAPRGRRPERLDAGRCGHARPPQPRLAAHRARRHRRAAAEGAARERRQGRRSCARPSSTRADGLKALRGLPFVLVGLSSCCSPPPSASRRAGAARRCARTARVRRRGRRTLLACSIAGDQWWAASARPRPCSRPSRPPGNRHAAAQEAATAAILYGAVMIAGAWLAGRTRPAVAVRRRWRRTCATRRSAYGVLAVVVVLLLAWGPTPATRKPLLALLLIVLMAIGTEMLRRQIGREYPDARRGETMRRVRGAAAPAPGRAWAGHARAPRAAAPRWPARRRAWPRTEAEAEAARTLGSTSSSGSPVSRKRRDRRRRVPDAEARDPRGRGGRGGRRVAAGRR